MTKEELADPGSGQHGNRFLGAGWRTVYGDRLRWLRVDQDPLFGRSC